MNSNGFLYVYLPIFLKTVKLLLLSLILQGVNNLYRRADNDFISFMTYLEIAISIFLLLKRLRGYKCQWANKDLYNNESHEKQIVF